MRQIAAEYIDHRDRYMLLLDDGSLWSRHDGICELIGTGEVVQLPMFLPRPSLWSRIVRWRGDTR